MNLYFLTLACVCAGLLFDPVGFLRMTLLASFVHELGHILIYFICTKSLPPLKFSPAGISLKSTYRLSAKQDFYVTLAGPLTNLILAFLLYMYIIYKASYGIYFFMAINICIALYNFLPIGALDGARLLSLISNWCKPNRLYTCKMIVVWLFFIVSIVVFAFVNVNIYFKIALIICAIYLIFQENKAC